MADDDIPRNAVRAALITGGGRRIGAAIALTLARAGYAVVLHANNSRDDAEDLPPLSPAEADAPALFSPISPTMKPCVGLCPRRPHLAS